MHETMIHIQIVRVMRDDETRRKLACYTLNRLRQLEQRHRVHRIVGKIKAVQHTRTERFRSLSRCLGALASLRIRRIEPRAHAIGHKDDAHIPALRRQARHRAAAAESFIIRMGGNDEGLRAG